MHYTVTSFPTAEMMKSWAKHWRFCQNEKRLASSGTEVTVHLFHDNLMKAGEYFIQSEATITCREYRRNRVRCSRGTLEASALLVT